MNIVEFRKQYPQYDDMSDIKLSDALYTKHYLDLPREEFDAQFIAPTLPAPEVDVYGGIDPEGVMAEKAETQKALDFIGGLTETQMTGPTEGKVGFKETPDRLKKPEPTGEPVRQKVADYRGREIFSDQYGKWSVKSEEDFIELPEKAKGEIEAELGGLEEPWVDPTTVGFGAAGVAGKLARAAGAPVATALGRAATTGVVAGAAEYPIGTATEVVGEKYPGMALPFNLAVGVLSGMTVEHAIEKVVARRFTKNAPKAVIRARTKEVVEALKSEDYSRPLTREAAEEVNIQIKKGKPVAEKPVIKPEAPKAVKPKQVVAPEKKVAVEAKKPTPKVVEKEVKVKPILEVKPVKEVAPEKPKEPYSVGSSVKVGKSPQVNTILEELPATKQEKELGERFFKIKNEKTGEIQEVTFEDITPIKLKPVKPEPVAPLKERVAKKFAEEKGEVTIKQAEAFAGKKVPVWEDIKKMRKSSAEKRKTTLKQVAKDLNKATLDVSGNLKRKALKAGPEGKRVVMRHDLIAGAHSASIRDVNKATDVIYKGLSEAHHDYLDSYAYAKRSLEILKDRPKFKFFGDRTKADFEQMLDNIPKDILPKIEKRATKYWDTYNNLLKESFNEGLLTKQELDDLTKRGLNYSPREILEKLDPGAMGGGGKISVPDSGIKALTEAGSLKAVETDTSLLLSQAISRTKTRIFRNKAAKSLYDMAKTNPDNGVVKIAKVLRTTKDGKPVYEPAQNGFEKISVMIGGKKKEMIMPSEMAREWIKSDPILSSNAAETISILSGTKVLKAMATGLNPEFALTNFPRDLAHVWLTTQEYSKHAPLAALELTKDIKDVWSDAIFRKGLYDEYIKRGGGMEFLTHQGRFAPKMKGHWGKLQNVMGYTGESSEIAVRLALMQRTLKNMKKAGRTDTEVMLDEATWIARNYLDFSQGGSVVKAADTAIPYMNAAIQGTRGVFRAAEKHPGKTAYKISQIAAMATGLYYVNHFKNKENWDSIPHRDKVNNWIITSPFSYKDKNGNKKWLYVRIPKDQSQRVIASVAENAAAKSIGEEVDMDQVTQAAADFVPVSFGSLAPPIYKAWEGYALNKDFYRGEDIWRGSREDIKAEEEYYKNYTHDFFIQAGRKTGLSPERLKYALGQYFTSGNVWTSMVGFGWDHIFAEMPEEDQEKVTEELILKKPFIRKLFRHTDPYHKFSKEIKDVTIEERTKKFVMMRDFNDIVQKKLKDKATDKDIVAFIQKNPKEANVLKTHYKRALQLRDMPEKRYWKELAKIPASARARLFWARWKDESPEERIESLKTSKRITGFFSKDFNRKFGELRNQTMKEEANKGRQ